MLYSYGWSYIRPITQTYSLFISDQSVIPRRSLLAFFWPLHSSMLPTQLGRACNMPLREAPARRLCSSCPFKPALSNLYPGLNFLQQQLNQSIPFTALQSAGWIITVGFSIFFAAIALFLVWVDVKFAGHKYNSEQFNTAGRSVKAGLIGVDVVSHFTWASILLSCVTLSYLNGVSNSMW